MEYESAECYYCGLPLEKGQDNAHSHSNRGRCATSLMIKVMDMRDVMKECISGKRSKKAMIELLSKQIELTNYLNGSS